MTALPVTSVLNGSVDWLVPSAGAADNVDLGASYDNVYPLNAVSGQIAGAFKWDSFEERREST